MACGLYDPREEKDSCGVGMVADISGRKSHTIVADGLRVLENLAHRGAENADGLTGDGSGITVQIPHSFITSLGIKVPEAGRYGTGLIFLPRDGRKADACMSSLIGLCEEMGLMVVGVRDVPVDHTVPGPMAAETEPLIRQIFITDRKSVV